MPPEEYTNLTVHEDVLALLAEVQVEYDCDRALFRRSKKYVSATLSLVSAR
jgi:hypothetical protein